MAAVSSFVVLIATSILCPWSTTVSGFFSQNNNVLYRDGDDVTLLNATNFNATILASSNAWIVQFYNSWCGHCIKFAPSWIELAHSVKAWHSVIRVAAINCADEVNLPVCRHYEIYSFPNIKFFGANARTSDLGESFKQQKDVVTIRKAMIDFVSSNHANPQKSWPILDPISYLDMKSLWRDIPENVTYVAIVIETLDSDVGRTIILDSLPYRNYVRIFKAVRESSPLIENFKEVTLPFMILTKRNGELRTFTSSESFLRALMNIDREIKDSKGDVYNANMTVKAELQSDKIKDNTSLTNVDLDNVYLQDFETVLFLILRQEIALQKAFSRDKLGALKSFFTVMAKYFPAREKTVIFLTKFALWLNNQTAVDYQALENKINELENSTGVTLKREQWMGCRGSSSHFRGYPCGLWTTFHALTVSAFIRNASNREPLEVVGAMRKYIMNFFGCQICVDHFTNMSANIANEIKSQEDSVLWLWQAHNKVNARLKGEPSDDPIHPKQQFPTFDLCPHCKTDTDDVNQWDLNAVLEFLISYYSGHGIVGWQHVATVGDDDFDKDAMSFAAVVEDYSDSVKFISSKGSAATETVVEKKIVKRQQPLYIAQDTNMPSKVMISKWNFGKSDISICVLLYVLSIVLLFLCYYFILTRRRKISFSLCRTKKAFHFV